jgi:hypothetical protein
MTPILSKEIRNRIVQGSEGRLFVVGDFADLNNDALVTSVLSRLEKDKLLIRLSQGIYLYPIQNRYGIRKPSIDVIAKAIVDKDKARIIPSGVTALNMLGLSTQVPMNAIYLTNGTPRIVTVGNRKILFKKSVPRNFAYQSKLFPLVVSAMKEMGEENINDDVVNKLRKILAKEIESLWYSGVCGLNPFTIHPMSLYLQLMVRQCGIYSSSYLYQIPK